MDVCHHVRSLDPSHGWYKTQGDDPYYYALTSRVPNNFAIYTLYRRCWPISCDFALYPLFSWDRACPDLKEQITLGDAVDNSLGLAGGSLGLVGAEAGFDQRYRIPGTSMKYQCSEGFDTGNGNNPVQTLTCTAGRKVDFSGISQCRRKGSHRIPVQKGCFLRTVQTAKIWHDSA